MKKTIEGILVREDDPRFLEDEVNVSDELFDFTKLTAAQMHADWKRHQANYETAPFDPLGNHIRFYPDGYTIWSGFPGAGKTTLLRQFMCKLMADGRKIFIASLEENPGDIFHRLAAVALGVQEPSIEGLQWCIDAWHDRLRIWSHRRGIAPTAKLLAVIRVLSREDGISHSFIDSMMRLDIDGQDFEAQRVFGNDLQCSAAMSNSAIHLVAHPRKIQSINGVREPDVDDIGGSANLGRLSDNVIFIRRTKTETVNPSYSPMMVSIRKQRYHNGSINDIEGLYARELNQFVTATHVTEATRYLPSGAYGQIEYSNDDHFKKTPTKGRN